MVQRIPEFGIEAYRVKLANSLEPYLILLDTLFFQHVQLFLLYEARKWIDFRPRINNSHDCT